MSSSPVGSSASRISGSLARATARPARAASPPDSVEGPGTAPPGETHTGEQLRRRVPAGARLGAGQRLCQGDVALDGQVLDEVARLQEHPDVACPERGPVGLGAPGEPGSGDGHVAPVGLVEAGKARHQRRLPAPGRADDRDHLAAVHRE